MLKRSASLLPLLFALLLSACAGSAMRSPLGTSASVPLAEEPTAEQLTELTDDQSYQLPGLADNLSESLADNLVERGFELIGTPYRFGGRSSSTGFDCSGFVGFLFREEAGIQLPRSTREMIKLDAPLVARSELEPGDILFFNNRGRGRVSHAGIYIGDNQFIHSSSHHSGGVRVDSLSDRYWRASYMEAKRVLAAAHAGESGQSQQH